MENLTIIIPVHQIKDEQEMELLKRSLSSAQGNSIILSCSEEVDKKANDAGLLNENIDVNVQENTSLANLVNTAAKKCKTEYMSVLEFDDYYTNIWFKNVESYMQDYPDVEIFMPLTELIDYNKQDKGPIGYINEVVWASSFSEELGFWDAEALNNYYMMNFTGSVIKTKLFLDWGGLKESIKLVMWYELLLRLVTGGAKAFVIPKVGYTHIVNRDGSMISNISKEMSDEESEGWVNIAKEECLFKKDRNKTYSKK